MCALHTILNIARIESKHQIAVPLFIFAKNRNLQNEALQMLIRILVFSKEALNDASQDIENCILKNRNWKFANEAKVIRSKAFIAQWQSVSPVN